MPLRCSLLLLLPLLTGTVRAQERALPRQQADDLEDALGEASAGRTAALEGLLSGLATSPLTPIQQEAVADETLRLGWRLIEDQPQRALTVLRALRAALPNAEREPRARRGCAQALIQLGQPAAALKLCASLLGPPPKTRSLGYAAALKRQHFETLELVATALQALKRPVEALQACLDQRELEYAWVSSWGTIPEIARVWVGRELTDLEATVLQTALDLSPRHAVDLGAGARTWEIRAGDYLKTAAAGFRALKSAELAAALLAAVPEQPLRRAYPLPPLSRQSFAGRQLDPAAGKARRARLAALEARARAGEPAAQLRLAERLEHGSRVWPDPTRAVRLVRAAAAQGHAPALAWLAERADADADRIGYALRAIAGGAETDAILEDEEEEPLLRASVDDALRGRLAARARAGSAQAARVLVRVTAKTTDEFRWLRRLAFAGHTADLGRLATRLLRAPKPQVAEGRFWDRCDAIGAGYAEDHATKLALLPAARAAREALLAPAARTYPLAAAELAWLIHARRGPAARALELLLRGRDARIDGGIADASALLERDPKQTWRLLGAATHAGAHHLRGLLLMEEDFGPVRRLQAVEAHREEARRARRKPCDELLELLSNDEDDVIFVPPHIPRNEVAWARAAAKGGDAWAAAYLGWLHTRGIGVPLDPDAARAWFTKAAALDLGWAHAALAELEAELEGREPRPSVDAHLLAAVKLGHVEAWEDLHGRAAKRGAKAAAQALAAGVAAKCPDALLQRAAQLRAQPAQALPLLRAAARAGSVRAYVQLLIALRAHPKLRVAGDP